ncbi:hypothetical protein ABH37_19435 [Mycobacterium haemophilum]|uniref:Uncharacterized protein n=1 Tax=Mycobacterium haemophilum TaxID=29311 RepID=A0A0I9U0F0_9MYCO|nr:hypothetical protein [Mycobacterium haemophilum]KLO25787.1 hypothetical protein ABH39_19105 [Mycobacterium haemophilum]KLO34290.1 hypothetical protein ABH38_19360 [Mycobacterium haemophilum]KLO36750.1 hypothetical protein ABH37_19435 [Mycobacterium haemophilum]KLO45067.1 hypothetical protein ABH36_19220 [Mycobacterium haemophilum]
MALLALGGIFMLFMVLLAAVLCLGSASSSRRSAPPVTIPFGVTAATKSKQFANTPASAMGVYQVMPSAGCWPGVWVGFSPVVHARPVVSPVPERMQRRHPSAIVARATSHGALR